MSLEDWIYDHLEVRDRLGEELNVVCPVHQTGQVGKADMWVSLEKEIFGCFSSACGFSGRAAKLIQFVEGGTFQEAERKLGDPLPRALRELDAYLKSHDSKHDSHVFPRMSWAMVQERESNEYWSSRGLSEEAVAHFHLGYDYETNEALIPYIDSEGPVCFIRRRTTSGPGPRYRYPKGFSLTEAVFNLHAVDSTEEVVVVEGAVDCMSLWDAGYENSVALLGSGVNANQVKLLAHLRCVAFFDRDSSGVQAAIKLCETHPRIIRVARYPHGVTAKDPAELTPEERMGAIVRAIPSTSFLSGRTA